MGSGPTRSTCRCVNRRSGTVMLCVAAAGCCVTFPLWQVWQLRPPPSAPLGRTPVRPPSPRSPRSPEARAPPRSPQLKVKRCSTCLPVGRPPETRRAILHRQPLGKATAVPAVGRAHPPQRCLSLLCDECRRCTPPRKQAVGTARPSRGQKRG